MTFTLGITDYSNYTQRLRDYCFHQTFQYKDKTYITIITNQLLNELIHLARSSYQNVKKTSPDNIYIRVDSSNLNNNHITNTTPTQDIEKYLSVNHIKLTPPTEDSVSLIGKLRIKDNLTNSQVKKLNSIVKETDGVSMEIINTKPPKPPVPTTKPSSQDSKPYSKKPNL